MPARTRLVATVLALLAGACATPEPPVVQKPPEAPVPPPAAPPAPDPAIARAALLEEARAMLAQAETDVQRARARRALWQKAWEDLLAAREALARSDAPIAIRHARRASELAQLGLEQLSYPPLR